MKKKLLITILPILFVFVALPKKNLAQAAVNDDCENAIELILGMNACINPVNGTTENATQSITPSNPSCDYIGGVDDDVWYKFTAPNSGFVNLSFSNIAGGGPFDNLSAAVYGGDCNFLIEVSCSQNAGNLGYLRVTLGTTYYLRLYSYANDPGIHKSFTLCAYMVNNDECINAKELTIGTILTREYYNQYGTTDGATESTSNPIPSCSDGYNDDVWYKFTAASTENIHVRFQRSAAYTSGSISAQVYSGTCSNLTALDCKSTAGYNPSYININAVAGTDYYVRVFSTDPNPSVAYDFYITAYTLTPAPVNDECDNAAALSLGDGSCSGGAYGYTTLGATLSTNTPAPSCDAIGTDDDIWFKFSSTAARPVRIEIQNSYYAAGNNSGITAQLYSGSCNGLVPVSCNSYLGYTYSSAENFSFELNADAATDYYVRVFTPGADPTQYAMLNVCAYYLPPPPANDECEGAILVPAVISTQCASTTNGTTIGANGSSMPGCYGITVDDDVWYKFIATASSHIINVTPATVNGLQEYTAFQVVSGDCGTLTELNCVVSVSPAGPAQQAISNLTVGDTYYVRVYSLFNVYSYKGDFSICITTPNDECSTAEMLTVNPTDDCTVSTNGSTKDATQSPVYYYCNGNYDDDVWYKFIATSASHKIKVTPTATDGIINVVFQVFNGDCSSYNAIYCIDNTIGQDAEEITAAGLIPGDTYYIRVYSYDYNSGKGDFTVCITTTNDECAVAQTLTVNPDMNCTVTTRGTTAGATASPLYTCFGTLPNDVWYKFTSTATTQKLMVTPASTNGISDVAFEIFGGDCNGLSQVNCVNNTVGTQAEETYMNYLTIGATYYVRVFSYDINSAPGDFDICVASLPNNNCNDAITLTVNPDGNCVSNTHGTSVVTGTYPQASCVGDADDDVWYVFNATYDKLKLKLTPSATNGISNAVMEIFEGYCGGTSIACVNNTVGSDPEETNLTGLTIGQWYTVRVFSYDTDAGSGDFDICVSTITTAPVNDECTGAIPLTVSADYLCSNPVNGTTLFATQSMPGCNGTGADDDVWYSFVALGSSQMISVSQGYNNTIYNPMMEVFTGNCGSLTSVGCYSNFSPYGFSYNVPTIPGTLYFIRIYSADGGTGQGDFTICATTYYPLNDDCIGAVNVPVNTDNTCTLTTSGTTVHASSSGIFSGCMYGPPDDDVWYKFTAAANAQLITVTPALVGGINNAVVEVYDGTCNTYLGYLGCANFTSGSDAESIVAEGLTVGNTYYFRVYSAANYSGQGAFSVCINSTVANDDCSGALTIPVNDDATCNNTYDGTTVGAANSQLQVPLCSEEHDVWYKFVAGAIAYNINVTPAAIGGINGVTWGLFSGNCNSLTRLGCTSSAATFENLIIGNTYYLQVANTQFNPALQGAFTICVTSINATVPNDICSGAIDVPISNEITCVTNVTGTTTGAGISLTTGLKDVWYKFTATETAHKIKVSPVSDSLKNIAFQVYSGSCGSLASMVQVNNYPDPGFSSSTDTTKPEIQSVENLIIGNTYYIRVYSGAVYRNNTIIDPAGSFNICVSLSANDVCSLAKTIPVNAGPDCDNITIDSTDYSTPALNLNYSNNCGLINPVNDSWFKFIALDTAQMITISQIAGNVGGTQLLSGNCGNLVTVLCGPALNSRQIYGGLHIGETYYLQVYSGLNSPGAKFSVCVSAVAINNECDRAFTLPVNTTPGCTIITNGSTRGSTPSTPAAPYYYYCSSFYNCGYYGCDLLVGNDVWYKFVATATQHKLTVTGTTEGLNLFFTVYSGDCNSLNSIVCTNDYNPLYNSTDEEAAALDNLVIGNTYYVRVYNQAGLNTVGNFTICVGFVDPLNDLCSNVINVPVNNGNNCNLSVTGSNVGATRSYDVGYTYNNGQYGCYTNGTADVFYKFTATSIRHLITVTPTASGGIDDVVFTVFSGSCGHFSNITSVDESVGSSAELRTLDGLVIGQTYYIQVYNSSGEHATRGGFTVCISAPLVNDACSGAIELAVNTTSNCTLQTTGTTVGATPGTGLEDVWYKFVATAPEHEITVTGITLSNPSFTLYKGDCTNLVAVREEIDYNANATGSEFQSFDSLVAGNTYYLRVRSSPPGYSSCPKGSYGSRGTFTVCVGVPTLLNDLIDEAVNVPVNNGTTCTTVVAGTNVGSSFSNNYSECYRTHMNFNSAVSDVWYKFTAVSTSQIITVSPTVTGSISEVNFSVFERITSGADGLQQRGCVNLMGGNATETQSFNGLIIGKTYYIRVMNSVFTNTQGSFTVCITTPVLPGDDSKIITFAGGGTGEGVSAANSQLYKPTDVAVDATGNVYIADAGYIKKINKADGVMSIIAGTGVAGFSGDGGPATAAQIPFSCKIAADKFGNIFIGDYDRSVGKLRKINSNGIITTILTLPQDYFTPTCFFCVGSYHRRAITGITTDASGNIYFTVNRDEDHFGALWEWSDLHKLTPSGTLTTLTTYGQFFYGTTVDAAGNVYFVQDLYDPFYNYVSYRYIKKTDAVTHVLSTVGGTQYFGYTGDGADATKANMKPTDVKADAAGNLYIADGNGNWNGKEYGNYSIRKISPAGIISTIAGTSINDYTGDNGPATLAAMHTPVAIAVDSSGDVYIADVKENEYPVTTANRIRKIITNCSGGIAMGNMGNTFYINTEKIIYKDCDTIAKVTAVSPAVFNKDITAKVWIEPSTPSYNNIPYVARHYEIMPRTDPSATTTRITLYFTQQEFTDYNAAIGAGNLLPADGVDAANDKANLRIIQRDGSSTDGTGLQETYTVVSSTIDPDDNDIVWNSEQNRWEVTFTASGSNGFFVQTAPAFITLNLKVFLEGFYTGNSQMRANQYDLGMSTDPSATDAITINLWEPAHTDINTYPEPDHTSTALLHTDGTATLQFPATVSEHSFYIAVKHRNSLETWSKLPVLFTTNTIYDFTTGLEKAYDDAVNPPMAAMASGVYAIYGGDVNQDGGIDASDLAAIDNDNSLFAFGYNATDTNGDGASDASDLAIVDNNSQLFLFYARPF